MLCFIRIERSNCNSRKMCLLVELLERSSITRPCIREVHGLRSDGR